MTHEQFVREARAALSFVPPKELQVSTHDSHVDYTGTPWHAQYVRVMGTTFVFSAVDDETDDEIRAGLSAFASKVFATYADPEMVDVLMGMGA